MKDSFVVQDAYVFKEETHLTVLKTSLFFSGDGFTAYDSHGQLVFRVDTYGPDARDKHELVLMDPHGLCLLTVRRKRPSLHQRWEGFKGERMDGDKPIFSVKRSSIIGRSRASLTVEIYDDGDGNGNINGGGGGGGGGGEEQLFYQIEGCFAQRNCTIYNAMKESMAEIRRKVDQSTSVLLGKEVFTLCVKAGFDSAFAMGLVLVLDQINGDDNGVDDGTEPTVYPTAED